MPFLSAVRLVLGPNGQRLDQPAADGTFGPVDVQLGPGLTGTYTPNGAGGIVLVSVAGGVVSGTTLTLGSGTPTPYTLGPQPSVLTTSAAAAPLLAAAVPVSVGSTTIRARVKASFKSASGAVYVPFEQLVVYVLYTGSNLDFGNAIAAESNVPRPYAATLSQGISIVGAANNGSGLVRLAVGSSAALLPGNTLTVAGVGGTTEANGQQTVVAVPDGTHVDINVAFVHAYTSGGSAIPNGCMGIALAGGNAQIQAIGIAASAWKQSETVHQFDVRSDGSGVYVCTTGGTTNNSGSGPTGTGAGITDGTAVWEFVVAGTGVPITWTCFLEVFAAP